MQSQSQRRIPKAPRILIIGAGSRGNAYAKAISSSTNGIIAAVAEPNTFKRNELGKRFIWKSGDPAEGQAFEDWRDFLQWEDARRQKESEGAAVPEGVDGVFVCTLDQMHAEIITQLAPLKLHIMSEKPLATTLNDCVDIYSSLLLKDSASSPPSLFAIGHVLRYSPHNILLRRLLLEEEIIGDVISVEHTEPVGWWHFSHSYVRYVEVDGELRVGVVSILGVTVETNYLKGKLEKGITHRAVFADEIMP
jgi:predicted dehydrogenase